MFCIFCYIFLIIGIFNYPIQGSKHGRGISNAGASSCPQIAPQQAPSTSLRGVSSDYQNSTEYNVCNMKGIFVPDSSHYNASSKNQRPQTPSVLGDGQHLKTQAFIGGCIDDGKQVVLSIYLLCLLNKFRAHCLLSSNEWVFG